jgi:hypothetical protein
MDPLLLEALRFGVAILAGGIVAVIAQRLAYGHDRRLRREAAEKHEADLQNALLAEIDENASVTAPIATNEGVFAPVHRTVWDVARGEIGLGGLDYAAIAIAYRVGDVYNIGVEMFMRGSLRETQAEAAKTLKILAANANEHFHQARKALAQYASRAGVQP